MRNLILSIIGLLAIVISFSSCEEAEELLDVTFNSDYETTYEFVIPAEGTAPFTFMETESIDPTSNSDYNTYIDKIKEVNIEELFVEVISTTKNIELTEFDISINNENYDATWHLTNTPIEVGTIVPLNNHSGQYESIEDIMLDKRVMTVNIDGITDENDVTIELRFVLKSYVIANPLD